jgi:hypothetical protein
MGDELLERRQAVNAEITEECPEADYEQLRGQLRAFADCNLEYARWVYTEEAFSGEMEMLEESCRAAVWIDRMFACGEQDTNGMLDCLGKSAKAWPKLGGTIKRFAVCIGEEQEKSRAAGDELRAMAEQVKKQVAVLLQGGMQAEALGIIRELRKMLPEDAELAAQEKELEKNFS